VSKDEGYTTVHPIPPYEATSDQDPLAKIDTLFDSSHGLGLGVVYDFRHTYRNPQAVASDVSRFKNKPALLSWYTADEPDGTSDNPVDVEEAYKLIQSLDPYHPVSLVLNCADYGLEYYEKVLDCNFLL
jgi:hypothetical protein